MTLQELYEKRGKLVAEARELLGKTETETDTSRIKEFEDRHDAIMSELDGLDTKIAREERTAKFEKAEEERRARNRPTGGNISAPGQDDPAGDEPTAEQRSEEYRQVYARAMCGADLTSEERSILNRGAIRMEGRAQTVGTNSQGGFTVPTTLMAEIARVMKDWGPMFDTDVCRVITTPTGNGMTLPTVDDTAKGAAPHTEGGAVTDDGGEDVVFGQKTLGAYAFDTEWIRWSWELDTDSIFGMELLLSDLLGERLARKGNAQLTIGGGAGAPNGIVTASGLGVTAAATAALAADEIIDFQHSVNAAYRRSPKCRWQFADSTLKAIRKLKDGDGNYLWQMGDVRASAPDVLLGKPYSINDDVPAIAAGATPMIFGDMSKYIVRKVGSVMTIVAKERFAPDLGILGLMRLDGELSDANAVKHLKMAAA